MYGFLKQRVAASVDTLASDKSVAASAVLLLSVIFARAHLLFFASGVSFVSNTFEQQAARYLIPFDKSLTSVFSQNLLRRDRKDAFLCDFGGNVTFQIIIIIVFLSALSTSYFRWVKVV